MNKTYIILLLQILEKEFKRRVEQTYEEEEADKWSNYHDHIKFFIRTIKKGGIK
tara:strand:+ start:46 stop:207 length:162 start_codon:yes stop_codon:yes gene_type:complete